MDKLWGVLGHFYIAEHSQSPPTLLQIVGWTFRAERPDVKRRYVYVRKVPVVVTRNGMAAGTGGEWEFDKKILARYASEIKKPVQSAVNDAVDGNAILLDGDQVLRYKSMTLANIVFDYAIPQPQRPAKKSAKFLKGRGGGRWVILSDSEDS